MKKYLVLLLVLLAVFLIPNKAYAEEKILEIDFEKYETMQDVAGLDKVAFEFLGNNFFGSTCEDDGDIETCKTYVIETDMMFYEGKYNLNDGTTESERFVLNNFTEEDTIVHLFTDDEKDFMYDNPYYGGLMEYDGVQFVFSKSKKEGVFISKIVLEEKTDGAVINNKAKANGLNIDVDVKFLGVSDYVIYKTTVKNNTDKDYIIDNETKFGDSEYIKYEFSFDDGDRVLLSGQTKIMNVKITYNKEIPAEILAAGNYTESNSLQVELFT